MENQTTEKMVLSEEQKEHILSKQLLRSGTSIGANVAEAQQAQSKPDFINKMNIALKEAYETDNLCDKYKDLVEKKLKN